MATPFTIVALKEAGSTQDEARQRFEGDPILVLADRQRAGRGRTGSAWEAAPRAVAASLAWEPGWPLPVVARLTLVAGLAALDVVGRAGLKWPNDLVIEDRKVGGILTERSGDVVVTGLGLNLFWPDPPAGYGALEEFDPGADATREIGRQWAERLLGRSARGPEHWGWAEYAARCVTVGCDITWEPGDSGTATGIAVDGGLIVATAHGEIVLSSGAIRSVRTTGGQKGAG